MANKKDNPLIGSFRAPVPDTPPPAGAIGEQKPAEPPKTAPDPKAAGAIPAKGGEGQKPAEPPKGAPDTKATGDSPAKGGEGQKPAEPPKAAPDPKATGDTPAKGGEGQKPAEPPKGAPDTKATGDTPAKDGKDQKPAEPPKAAPDPKATGDIPAKGGEGQKPAEPPKAAPDPKATGDTPAKDGEGKSQEQADLRFVKLADIKPLPGTYVKDTPRKDYIRYWQASGESIKTSVRVKTRISQLTEEGYYTGGIVPYGYRLENRGRTNKRNKEVCDLAIDPDEAEVVKVIFQKYVCEGYGSQRICRYLAEQGFHNRKGGNIPTTSINRIIKNSLYIGVLCNGESRSEEILTDLQIIDVDLFERAQSIIQSRSKPRTHREVPLNTKGQSLLVGNVYCGHCGRRLTLATSGRKYSKKDGTVVTKTYARYQCCYNTQHPGECDGPSGYGVSKLDNLIEQIVRIQFEQIKIAPPQELIKERQSREVDIAKAKLNLLNGQYQQKQKDYQDLRAETLRVIQGTSRLNVDLLNSIVEETTAQIKELEQQIKVAEANLQEMVSGAEKVRQDYAELMNWAKLFDNCNFEAKKMIIAQFVKAVRVKRDYEIEVEFNVAFDEFQQIYLEPEKEGEKTRGTTTILALAEKVGQAV